AARPRRCPGARASGAARVRRRLALRRPDRGGARLLGGGRGAAGGVQLRGFERPGAADRGGGTGAGVRVGQRGAGDAPGALRLRAAGGGVPGHRQPPGGGGAAGEQGAGARQPQGPPRLRTAEPGRSGGRAGRHLCPRLAAARGALGAARGARRGRPRRPRPPRRGRRRQPAGGHRLRHRRRLLRPRAGGPAGGARGDPRPALLRGSFDELGRAGGGVPRLPARPGGAADLRPLRLPPPGRRASGAGARAAPPPAAVRAAVFPRRLRGLRGLTAETGRLVLFTVAVAAAATGLILVPGVGAAWALSRPGFRLRALAETVVSLPLVLPPTAVGLGLLLLFGRNGPLGRPLYERLGIEVAFTWRGVV